VYARVATFESDASKVALVGLVERFHADGDPRRLVDVQWATDHLRRLGAARPGHLADACQW